MTNILLHYYSIAVPEIVSPPDGNVVTVNQFQSVVLQCSAIGIPPPELAWMRTRENLNQTITNSTSFAISTTNQQALYQLENGRGEVFRVDGSLTINSAVDYDTGSYFCVANSTPGSDSQEIQLVVQGKQ